MDRDRAVERFEGALLLLPYRIRDRLRELDYDRRASAEELRLRINRPVSVVFPGGERSMGGDRVEKRDLDFVLELATGASVHAVRDRLRGGYLTVRGGYRLGVCGTALTSGGELAGFQSVSSLALRVSREVKGCAEGVLAELRSWGSLPSVLLISPPGGGKTTLLRDLVRLLASGKSPLRVALADERSEIAASFEGVPLMDVGETTDVLDGCPKAEAVTMLLRSMNPEVIAVDELSSVPDAEAMLAASNCGVRLIATAHAANLGELTARPVYRRLLEAGIFGALVTIESGRRYRVTRLGA